MKLCLDTNVLVAGLRSPKGASRQLLTWVAEGGIEPVASVAMFLEYEAVLKRPKHLNAFGLTESEIDRFLDGLTLFVTPVKPWFLWRPSLKDPADEHVLEAAVNGMVDGLVTFNTKDFKPASKKFGLKLYTPSEVYKVIKWQT